MPWQAWNGCDKPFCLREINKNRKWPKLPNWPKLPDATTLENVITKTNQRGFQYAMDREVLKFFDLLFKEQSKCIKNAPELVEGGKAMALKVMNKINSRLKFVYRKNRYLTPYLKWLLCNALIQPHFDYDCSAGYPNLNKKLKNKLQTVQNRHIRRYWLQLDNRSHIGVKPFEKINWLYLCSLTLLIFLRKLVHYLYFHDIYR